MFAARARSKIFQTMLDIINKIAPRNRFEPANHNGEKTGCSSQPVNGPNCVPLKPACATSGHFSKINEPAAALLSAPRCNARELARIRFKNCSDCGKRFELKRADGEFCSAPCRRNFGNRRMLRGAAFYDLVMATRFDRDAAETQGAWSLLCRMAAAFKAEDDAERASRKSWDNTAKVRARNPSMVAKLVGVNVAGGKSAR
jgi:hypothetical protein